MKEDRFREKKEAKLLKFKKAARPRKLGKRKFTFLQKLGRRLEQSRDSDIMHPCKISHLWTTYQGRIEGSRKQVVQRANRCRSESRVYPESKKKIVETITKFSRKNLVGKGEIHPVSGGNFGTWTATSKGIERALKEGENWVPKYVEIDSMIEVKDAGETL